MLSFESIFVSVYLPLAISILLYNRLKKKKGKIYLFFLSIFLFYLSFVIKYTLFPIPVNKRYLAYINQHMPFHEMLKYRINFFPLWIRPDFTFLTKEQILNIILCIPFGFLINFIIKTNISKIFFYSFLIGFSIESLQMLLSVSIRHVYRTIDINDIIFNFTGGIIGFLFYLIIARIYVFICDYFNIQHNEFTYYIYIHSITKRKDGDSGISKDVRKYHLLKKHIKKL